MHLFVAFVDYKKWLCNYRKFDQTRRYWFFLYNNGTVSLGFGQEKVEEENDKIPLKTMQKIYKYKYIKYPSRILQFR